MIKILLADDHSLIRVGLKFILLSAFDGAIVEEAIDGKDLLNKIISKHWDIVICDITMPLKTGFEVLDEIKLHSPTLPVLILSGRSESEYGLKVLRLGAAGYLDKCLAPEELVNAVIKVLNGEKYFSKILIQQFTKHQS